jgi:phosphoenolpyruvate carboxylase
VGTREVLVEMSMDFQEVDAKLERAFGGRAVPVKIGEQIQEQLKYQERRLARLRDLQKLLDDNPVIREALDLMRELGI